MQENYLEKGEDPDEEAIINTVTQNANTREEKDLRIKLFKKYPSPPDEMA